jgi:glycosyltransferase involved in cell wall biosynthesis
LKILVLNWKDIRNPDAGGAEVFVHEISRCWTQWGHQVTIFGRAFEGSLPEERSEGVRIVRRGGRFSVYPAARRWVNSQPVGSFDLIFESVSTRPFFAPQFSDAPTVTLFHQTATEIWNYEVPFPFNLLGRYLLEPRWLRKYKTSYILTHSKSTADDLRGHGLRNVHIVQIGTTVPKMPHAETKETIPTLIFVGRMAANKRPDHAIEAYRLIRQQIPECRLWMVGNGPMLDKLQSQTGEGIHFFGKVDQLEKFRLLSRAHALLATSVREGWGLMVTEAAAMGTLPIGYDVAGLRDSITAAKGILVEQDVQRLASAVAGAIETEAVLRYRPVAPASWERTARECLDHMRLAMISAHGEDSEE